MRISTIHNDSRDYGPVPKIADGLVIAVSKDYHFPGAVILDELHVGKRSEVHIGLAGLTIRQGVGNRSGMATGL